MVNWANVLTVLRMLLAPVFLFFLLRGTTTDILIALAVFLVGIITDILDGYLARKLDCVSNFGKFMDPLADKLLVLSAFITFAVTGWITLWIVLVFVLRELFIMGFRVLAAGRGIYIYASNWGKWKAGFQMATVIAFLALGYIRLLPATGITGKLSIVLHYGSHAVLYIALALTLFSGALYLWRNRQVIKSGLLR
ncbi:MAG: CDP-diacylglycerol--glycerol-3-phosphate 3-phosphatidyltransferase [bacterium]|nr:CDP-diacylglycerol--glycerol-3-phosphate 3-phosphatidyltransferase [bacterium]